jgi:hypothetical protein
MCLYYQVILFNSKDATKNGSGEYLNDGFCCTYPGLSESSSTVDRIFIRDGSEKVGGRNVI